MSSNIDTYQTINPTTEEVVKNYPSHSDTEVIDLLSAAEARYQSDWRHRSLTQRTAFISAAASLVRQRASELSQLITLEVGKLIAQSEWEVDLSASILEYYALHGEELLATEKVPGIPDAVILTKPLGVILAIEPWNFPLYQIARVVGPQLVAGNVVVTKPAPSTPQCALAFARCFEDAGVPEGVFTNVFCSVEQAGNLLIDDFRVRGVTITGSEKAGRQVAEHAGRGLKKCVLELGGSDPALNLEDADLQVALEMQGKRGALPEAFDRVIGYSDTGRSGKRKDIFRSCFIWHDFGYSLVAIREAKRNGACVVRGGGRINCPGFYLKPTILTNISTNNPISQQEIFGPVVSYHIVDTEEEGVEIANSTGFGLGCSVFSVDKKHAVEVASRIDSGMAFINSCATSCAELPFGGVKNSGIGRELGALGIGEFVNKRLLKGI